MGTRSASALRRLAEADPDRLAACLAAAAVVLYASTLSISLDEIDSVHFALGLRDFNIMAHQPHTPGFPVYMLLGKAFQLATGSDVLGLTLMSAVFGALSVFILYRLGREMFGSRTGLAAAALMAVTPLFWLESLKAMTDMTALFFTLLSLLFLYGHMKNRDDRLLYAGAVIGGISTGVRVHSFFIVLPALIFALASHSQRWTVRLKGMGLFLAMIAIWIAAVMLVTGPQNYLSISNGQFNFRVGKPGISLLGVSLTPNLIVSRLQGFAYYFLLNGYGTNLRSPFLQDFALFALALFILILAPKSRRALRDRRTLFIASALAIYLPVIFVLLPPFNARYLIILVPVISLMAVRGIAGSRTGSPVRNAVLIALALVLIAQSAPLAWEIHTTSSPAALSMEYMQAHYGRNATYVSGGIITSYVKYYNLSVESYNVLSVPCGQEKSLLDRGRIVVSNAAAFNCAGVRSVMVANYSRNPKVHYKQNYIAIYEHSFQ